VRVVSVCVVLCHSKKTGIIDALIVFMAHIMCWCPFLDPAAIDQGGSQGQEAGGLGGGRGEGGRRGAVGCWWISSRRHSGDTLLRRNGGWREAEASVTIIILFIWTPNNIKITTHHKW
jgi:hypothetical protein